MPAKKTKNNAKVIDSSRVMSSVATVISFMKEQVVSDLMEAKNKGSIELSQDDLKKICYYVETSMTNSFVRASGQIENSLN